MRTGDNMERELWNDARARFVRDALADIQWEAAKNGFTGRDAELLFWCVKAAALAVLSRQREPIDNFQAFVAEIASYLPPNKAGRSWWERLRAKFS